MQRRTFGPALAATLLAPWLSAPLQAFAKRPSGPIRVLGGFSPAGGTAPHTRAAARAATICCFMGEVPLKGSNGKRGRSGGFDGEGVQPGVDVVLQRIIHKAMSRQT